MNLLNPYSILIAIAIFAGGMTAVGFWQNHAGHTAERVQWQERETKQLEASNVKIRELEERARDIETQRSMQMAAIANHYEQEKVNAKVQRDRDIAAARSGAIRLSVNAACKGPGGGDVPGTGPGASVGDAATTRVDLPGEVTADLLSLANDADALAGQLKECQAIIQADRSADVRVARPAQ